jgi:nucleotide-binding universal stress UspA family protein
MMRIEKILVPSDLSEHSQRALRYAVALATDNNATVTVVHVANELNAWELFSEEFGFVNAAARTWPLDRVLEEASLELHRFLETQMDAIKQVRCVTKRVVIGPVARAITHAADDLRSDLIIMSPRRYRGLRRILSGSITDTVTRMSPCPVLSITAPIASKPRQGRSVFSLFGTHRQPAEPVGAQ